MKQSQEKAEWKEAFVCYLVILIIFSIFLGTIAISGEIAGTHWMSYISKFEWDINIDLLRQLFFLE
ncbi:MULTISPECIES: hypothetical protein [Clostridia]|uniref:hypothetical protein n=1 Tax=Clostridia TaxID=186801 RepID=UPI000EA3D34B|nr:MULTISPECIES: hypothetical protein [Clostridia]NBJ70802.1 hypothetical protein [Roseburia sp. 1XD42-34]RKI75774.1 hypothetical protein D7V87_15245 [Clostridium sp. 1xD42-85]